MYEIEKVVDEAVDRLFGQKVAIELTRTDEKFGDFSTNVALKLAKQVGKNPREIAQRIAENVNSDQIAKTEVAGPGFINITLTDQILLKLAATDEVFKSRFDQKKVVIETNNPNPFKAMHIGHAMNAIVADSLANLIEAGGAETHRVSYHGDVGLHVGKSMYSLLKFVDGEPKKLDEVKSSDRNSFMSKMYAEGSRAYKEDELAKAEIDELAKHSFTLDDPIYKKVYETCKNWSFEQIDQIVKRLGNKPIEKRFLESQADIVGVKTVKENVPEVFQESDGALIFKGSEYGSFDNAFVTSSGLGLYGARDLGLMQLKDEAFQAEKSYIITGNEQAAYFKGVIAAAEQCLPSLKDVTVNVPTGLVKLSTGKMSSRDGDVLEISWLFDQVGAAMKQRGGEVSDELITGALRYEFLRVKIGGDVIFDINESVSLQGNSGPYLQYAHARACSIINKARRTEQGVTLLQGDTLQAGERSLVRKIGEYNEVIERAVSELMPHHICTYLYELAQIFNRFYESNRVIGDERETVRLQLVDLYRQKLAEGLALLGIHAPEKM